MRYVKYKKDSSTVIYKVCAKQGTKVLLRGITYRKEILVDQSEVENVQEEELKKDYNILEKYKFIQQYKKRSKKYLLGTVLHIDSDKEYLEKNFEQKHLYLPASFSYKKIQENLDNVIKMIHGIDKDKICTYCWSGKE